MPTQQRLHRSEEGGTHARINTYTDTSPQMKEHAKKDGEEECKVKVTPPCLSARLHLSQVFVSRFVPRDAISLRVVSSGSTAMRSGRRRGQSLACASFFSFSISVSFASSQMPSVCTLVFLFLSCPRAHETCRFVPLILQRLSPQLDSSVLFPPPLRSIFHKAPLFACCHYTSAAPTPTPLTSFLSFCCQGH